MALLAGTIYFFIVFYPNVFYLNKRDLKQIVQLFFSIFLLNISKKT